MNFRDLLAIASMIVVIPSIWISQGLGMINLPGEVIGATIAGWTLILQFYFRKKES